jgi:hypothetical protein
MSQPLDPTQPEPAVEEDELNAAERAEIGYSDDELPPPPEHTAREAARYMAEHQRVERRENYEV